MTIETISVPPVLFFHYRLEADKELIWRERYYKQTIKIDQREFAMKLYYFPGACSMAPHIALNWVGAQFDIENPDTNSDSYQQIHSVRQVPALVLDDGTVLTQCNAILRFIADSHSEANIGGASDPRSQYEVNRWLSYVATDLHRAHAAYFFQQRFIIDGSDEEHARVKQAAENLVKSLLEHCDSWLQGKTYTVGDRPTIADAYAFTVFRWSRNMAKPAYDFPNIKIYMDRMLQDAGVKQAMVREGLNQ